MLISTCAVIVALPWTAWPLLAWMCLAGLLAVRSAIDAKHKTASLKTAFWYGLHAHLQHVPMLCGQVAYFLNRRRALIEYIL